MKVKHNILFLLYFFMSNYTYGQISKVINRDTYYYDYFIFGVTDKKIKNIGQLCDKYKLDYSNLCYHNNRYKQSQNSEKLKVKKGDTLFLPPFTLDSINLYFEEIFDEFKLTNIDTLHSNNMFQNKETIPLDPKNTKELKKFYKYYKNLHFFELPEIGNETDKIIPLGKITISKELKLYFVVSINFNFASGSHYVYILKNNKPVCMPILTHFTSPQYTECINSKIFYYENELAIVKIFSNDGYGDFHHKKISLYTFDKSRSIHYDTWVFKDAYYSNIYEIFKVMNPEMIGTNILRKLKIVNEK